MYGNERKCDKKSRLRNVELQIRRMFTEGQTDGGYLCSGPISTYYIFTNYDADSMIQKRLDKNSMTKTHPIAPVHHIAFLFYLLLIRCITVLRALL